jgi:hypothetical protein
VFCNLAELTGSIVFLFSIGDVTVDSYTGFIPIWVNYSIFLSIALGRTSTTMLNRSGEDGRSFFPSGLQWERAQLFSMKNEALYQVKDGSDF